MSHLQTAQFPEFFHGQIVNVASVQQRSPFRYPGGKTWLIPRIRQWFMNMTVKPVELIEPFAGGAIVGLTSAFEQLVSSVTLVECDEQVAAVWDTILNGQGSRLAERVLTFNLTAETIRIELAKTDKSKEQIAFQTILRNRVNHGGILAPGSGMTKYGENGKGINSRWYPETLYKRIMNIVSVKERIHFIHGDGIDVIRRNANRNDVVFFIDPPYTAAGKKAGRRLYKYNELDHEGLFDIVDKLKGDFLMTYDNADGVEYLAHKHNFDTQAIAMKNTHHAEMNELLIGRNLDWLRS